MQITRAKHDQLIELIEDSVEYFCDENMVAGEVVYTILHCYSKAKIAQLKGECV
jgi:hypothetical protein